MQTTRTNTAWDDAVGALCAGTHDTVIRDAVTRWSAPLTVAVSGRPGVGKSRVAAMIGALYDDVQEIHGVDDPRAPHPDLDHDVLLHVVARTATPIDLRVIADRGTRETLVVAGRPDLASQVDPGLGAVSIDDPAALRAWWDRAADRSRRRRDHTLLSDLERLAAGRVDTRVAVETFLRAVPRSVRVR